eukprot:5102287-Prymnesium_polylepis.1
MAREHIAEGAVVDHIGPCPVFLDDFTRTVEVGSLSLDLLQAARLPMDDRLCPRLAALELGAVCNTVAQLARALAHMRGGLTQHPPHLAGRLHSVKASDPLPMLPASGRTDFQVGSDIVTAFVLGKVGLAGRVPTGEAAVADTLG